MYNVGLMDHKTFSSSNVTINFHPEADTHHHISPGVKLNYNQKFKNKVNSASKCNSSSTVQLVMSKEKIKHKLSLRLRIFYGITILLLIVALVVISILYVTTLQNNPQNKIIKTKEINILEPCFERAKPIKLKDVGSEKEVRDAIQSTNKKIINTFISQQYKALSLSVSYMGETIWNASYGKLNFSNPDSAYVTGDTPYPIASVSKAFTVIGLHKLIELGVIKSIDDEVQKYDSRFHVINQFNDDNTTFRQLACMMSGMQRESPCNPPTKKNLCPYNTSTIFQRLSNVKLAIPPDTTPYYSNLGISILGRILETQMKNETFNSWMKKYILDPLEMFDTGFDPVKREKEIPITNLYGDGDKLASVTDWGWSIPAAGMYSTVNDLGKLTSYLLGNPIKGSVIKRKQIQRLFTTAYTWSDSKAQGCPFEINYFDPYRKRNKRVGYISYSKDGGIFGYGSMIYMVPELKLGFNFLLAEPKGNGGAIFATVVETFIKAFDTLLKRKGKQYELPANVSYYTGSYKLMNNWPLIKNLCNVTLTEGVLYVTIEWFTAPLTQLEDHTLVTGNFGKFKLSNQCQYLGIGLLDEKLIFHSDGTDRASGFHINGISSFGYVQFKRVT